MILIGAFLIFCQFGTLVAAPNVAAKSKEINPVLKVNGTWDSCDCREILVDSAGNAQIYQKRKI